MDRLRISVLADGTVKSTSDAVSPENHQAAEAFLKMLAALTGGESHREARGDAATHSHHVHGEHTHTH